VGLGLPSYRQRKECAIKPSANPFAYRLEEIRKTVVALVVAVFAVAAFYIGFDPGFEEALVVTIEAAFGVVAVFLSTNYTAADVDKAVKALLTSGITLISFFTTVAPETGELVVAIAAVLVQFLGVYFVPNGGSTQAGGSVVPGTQTGVPASAVGPPTARA
jgi:hypothetical protein